MACEVTVANEARADLESAVLYCVSAPASASLATRLIDDFEGIVANIKQFPMMYPVANEARLARMGFRKALMGKYVVLYRLDGDRAVVARIFHQSRDYAKLL